MAGKLISSEPWNGCRQLASTFVGLYPENRRCFFKQIIGQYFLTTHFPGGHIVWTEFNVFTVRSSFLIFLDF
jgi:hypothetical protein